MVELDDVGRDRQRGEEGVVVRPVPLGHQQRTDLRPVDALPDAATARLGQQLGAEAHGQGRHIGGQCLPQQLPDADELGAGRLVVQGRLGTAEHQQPVVPVQPGRQLVAGVAAPLVELQPRVAQPLAEAGGRIGVTRDDDEQTGHPISVMSAGYLAWTGAAPSQGPVPSL